MKVRPKETRLTPHPEGAEFDVEFNQEAGHGGNDGASNAEGRTLVRRAHPGKIPGDTKACTASAS